MRPNWESHRDPDVEPAIEAAARRVLDSVDDLRTVRLRVERMDVSALLRQPTVVTEELMAEFAALPHASPELREYAERVRAGECAWADIERSARPLPPEVADLKSSPRFVWPWTPQPEPPAPPPRPRSGVVGPSDWPDDFEEYPDGKSWLV
ncbi:hypothetical protein [Nocardia sp. NPDC057353]|uniref:hypothetical protein n=1 Tax=Nocardia sp. NPDC057353 TaxID=3346104 RepID=UPI0036427520